MLAIFGKSLPDSFLPQVNTMIALLKTNNTPFICFKMLYEELLAKGIDIQCQTYSSSEDLSPDTTLILCLGGDGTMLETLTIVKDRQIPIVGVNTGKLGFLSEIFPYEISKSIDNLLKGNYKIQPRTLIEVLSNDIEIPTYNFALNDFTLRKNDQSTLVKISVSVDGYFLNTYWADGLIVSTATGSTAYSMSVGGPILVPESKSLILSPIASHNLTVRPLVIEKNSLIEIVIEGRNDLHVATFDNRNIQVPTHTKFKVRAADFTLDIAQLPDHHFFHTLRNKLMWGIDKRN
ncbi:MAG TPA: NAD kinase [Salinivirgaceae bacterium]|nr:NAD kinase [Salinivirgaceae bacterium]